VRSFEWITNSIFKIFCNQRISFFILPPSYFASKSPLNFWQVFTSPKAFNWGHYQSWLAFAYGLVCRYFGNAFDRLKALPYTKNCLDNHWEFILVFNNHPTLLQVLLGKVRVNQQPPMHRLAILSTWWAMFFHSMLDGVHHSPFLFIADHCIYFFGVCSWLFLSWT